MSVDLGDLRPRPKPPSGPVKPVRLEMTPGGFRWDVTRVGNGIPMLLGLPIGFAVGCVLIPPLAITLGTVLGSLVLLPPMVLAMAGMMVGKEVALRRAPAQLRLDVHTLELVPKYGNPIEVPLADVRFDPPKRTVHLGDRAVRLEDVLPGELEWVRDELAGVTRVPGAADEVPASLRRIAESE